MKSIYRLSVLLNPFDLLLVKLHPDLSSFFLLTYGRQIEFYFIFLRIGLVGSVVHVIGTKVLSGARTVGESLFPVIMYQVNIQNKLELCLNVGKGIFLQKERVPPVWR